MIPNAVLTQKYENNSIIIIELTNKNKFIDFYEFIFLCFLIHEWLISITNVFASHDQQKKIVEIVAVYKPDCHNVFLLRPWQSGDSCFKPASTFKSWAPSTYSAVSQSAAAWQHPAPTLPWKRHASDKAFQQVNTNIPQQQSYSINTASAHPGLIWKPMGFS